MAQFIKIISKGREYLVKLTSDEMEKGKKAQIGETSIFGDGKTYKKVSENRWEPISEPGSHTHKNSGGGHSMHDEKKSESQGDITPSKLHEKFRVYMENMPTERRALFRGGKMNFEKKMFVSNDGKLALHYKDGKITIAKHEGMEKAYNERPGHKYYKRIMKPTGKGFYYFYNKDEYEQFKDSKYKPEKKSIWSGIMAFFSLKDEKKAEEKVRSLHESNKEKLAGVSLKTFAQYLNEYITNKEKWNKKFSEKKSEKGESKGGGGDKKSSSEKKESGEKKSPTWNVKLMKTVAEIVGGVKGGGKDTIDYTKILTPQVKKHLHESVKAAIAEGNDDVSINSDGIISNFGDTLTIHQYENFNSDEAEKVLFNEVEKIKKELNKQNKNAGDKTEIMSGDNKKTREEKEKEVDEIISKWKKVFGNKFNDFELLTLNNIMLAEEKGKTQMIPANIKQVKENMPNLYKLFNKNHLRYAGALPATKEIESLINEYKSKSNKKSTEKPSETAETGADNFESMQDYQSKMVLSIKKELKQANKEFEKIDKKDWKHNRDLAIERRDILNKIEDLTDKLKNIDGSRGDFRLRDEYRKIVEKKKNLSMDDQYDFPDLTAEKLKKETGINFYYDEESGSTFRGIRARVDDDSIQLDGISNAGYTIRVNGNVLKDKITGSHIFSSKEIKEYFKKQQDTNSVIKKEIKNIAQKESKSKIYSDPNLKHKDGTYKTKIGFDAIRPKIKKLTNADEYEKQVFENLKVSNILNAQNSIKPAYMYNIDAQNDGVWTDSRALIHDKKVTEEIYKINKQNVYLETKNPKKYKDMTDEESINHVASIQYNAGQFPNWKQIMPKEIPAKKAEFTGWYDPDPKKPAAKVEYSDGDTTVWANANFIATMKTLFPTATMHLTGQMSPIVFKVGNEVKALVMPIQRNNSHENMVDIKSGSGIKNANDTGVPEPIKNVFKNVNSLAGQLKEYVDGFDAEKLKEKRDIIARKINDKTATDDQKKEHQLLNTSYNLAVNDNKNIDYIGIAKELMKELKMQKAAQLLLSELQKAKKAGMGETRTHKDGSKWKKVGEGKWEPVTEEKGGGSSEKKKSDKGKKKPDGKKPDEKKKEGEGKRGIMRDALKKVADILANALSMKETVDPAGQAIEKTGENEMDKNKKGLKTPNVKKPEKKKIPTTEGSWKKQKTDKPKKVPTNDI